MFYKLTKAMFEFLFYKKALEFTHNINDKNNNSSVVDSVPAPNTTIAYCPPGIFCKSQYNSTTGAFIETLCDIGPRDEAWKTGEFRYARNQQIRDNRTNYTLYQVTSVPGKDQPTGNLFPTRCWYNFPGPGNDPSARLQMIRNMHGGPNLTANLVHQPNRWSSSIYEWGRECNVRSTDAYTPEAGKDCPLNYYVMPSP